MQNLKILWVSNYREHSGYSEAARRFIKCLAPNIVCRHRSITGNNFNEDLEWIKPLEKRSSIGCNVAIQCTLPHLMEPIRDCHNVGLFFLDTIIKSSHPWIYKLNLMDSVVVTQASQKFHLENAGVTVPIHIFPVPQNFEVYYQNYPKLDLGPDYKFYFIGEFNVRKRIPGLVMAFHNAFRSEPASLVLKLSGDHNAIRQSIDNVKRGMKLRWYDNKEILLLDRMSQNEIYSLHKTCNCYVSASHGEGWNLPAFDARMFGNFCIPKYTWDPVTQCNSIPDEYIEPVVDSCFGAIDSPDGICCSDEKWINYNLSDLSSVMQDIYNKKVLKIVPQDCFDSDEKKVYDLIMKTFDAL